MKNKNKISAFSMIVMMLVLTVIELIFVGLLKNWLIYFLIIFLINAVILGFVLYSFRKFRMNRSSLIEEINSEAENSLQSTLEVLPVGIIRFNLQNFEASWYNKYTEYIFEVSGESLNPEVISSLVKEYSSEGRAFRLGDKFYSVTLDNKNKILYLQDITFENEIQKDLSNRRPIIGAIAIDNYDDLTDSLSDGNRSTINSFIANFLESFSESKQIYLRRQSADRYVFFANYQVLADLMQERFIGLLDRFREQALEQELPMTLSIGISYGIVDFAAIGRTALNNLDLALIRGGDQVVVKENEDQAKAIYFGGNSESRVEKSRTRVRAISAMLDTIVSESNCVFIVGHRHTDMDSLGAATMMKAFVTSLDKEAFIVYNHEQLQEDTRKAIEKLNEDEAITDHVIRLEDAQKMRANNALLIMVDHSKLSQTLDIDFYRRFDKVVVIDHHRRDEDFPENPLLSYIESGASSATEMAVEILQFQPSVKKKITTIEASVALAGISVDTKSFTKATTAKTFEAASYLRDRGADNALVQYFLATDFKEFKKVNEVVCQAEVYHEGIAIAKGKESQAYDKIILAKAADELLTLDNISASFTIGLDAKGRVNVSARSNGKKNVQTVMEKMGGGGHFDMAATQIENQTVEAVALQLLSLLAEG